MSSLTDQLERQTEGWARTYGRPIPARGTPEWYLLLEEYLLWAFSNLDASQLSSPPTRKDPR